jgi:phosphoribosyl 1,2-cyclic phosphate phosphodiesterase
LDITFLGTGTSQGVPVIACDCAVCRSRESKDKRLRSSILVETGNETIVVDTGPDFRQQMLRENVKKIDAVLFTHEHRDHIAGLDDIRAYNYILQNPMDVYAEERVIRALQYEFPYVFAERKYPGIPQINVHLIDEHPFNINTLTVMPIRALHYRLPVLGFRFGDFAYITDANHVSDQEKEKLQHLKIFAICALRKEKHISHFSLPGAINLIKEIKPEKAYLTHISHQMGLHANVEKELPESIFLAYDGLKVEL